MPHAVASYRHVQSQLFGRPPGSGVAKAGKERNTPGIFKDLGYLPDHEAIWRCPADSEAHRLGYISRSPYTDFFDPYNVSYAGNFNHHGMGWPTPPFSFPPGGGHVLEIHRQAEVYSPGNVLFAYDGPLWPASHGSNAVDNALNDNQRWPSPTGVNNDTVHRHAIDLPNILFCDGHAVPFDLTNLRDPENWAIEGWNQP